MDQQTKNGYKGITLTNQFIVDDNNFNPNSLPTYIKTLLVDRWNGNQKTNGGTLTSSNINILDYAFSKAQPNKIVITLDWQVV